VNEVSNIERASESRRTSPIATVPLSELVRGVQAGFATGERDPAGTIQVRMNNVTTEGAWDWSSFIRVPTDETIRSFYALQPGDVVFNNTNSTELVGKTALFKERNEPVVFSNHFTRLRTDAQRLAPEYLAHWLLSLWKQGVFARLCDKWIGQSAVQRSKLLALEIPFRPLADQKRIAERLREELAEVERAQSALAAQMQAAENLPAALLREAFCGADAQSWQKTTIADIASLVIDGPHVTPTYQPSGVPFLTIRNIVKRRIVPMSALFRRLITQSSPVGAKQSGVTFSTQRMELLASLA
jgi:type I restriction enzyme S subunit